MNAKGKTSRKLLIYYSMLFMKYQIFLKEILCMSKDEVVKLYVIQNMNMVDTAKELKVSVSVLRDYIVKNGIVKETSDVLKEEKKRRADEIWRKFNSSAMS